MSQPNRQPRDHVPGQYSAPGRRLEAAVAEIDAPTKPSPARALQQAVEDSWSPQSPTPPQQWSPRSTLLFSGAASLLIWTAIIGAAVTVSRLIDR